MPDMVLVIRTVDHTSTVLTTALVIHSTVLDEMPQSTVDVRINGIGLTDNFELQCDVEQTILGARFGHLSFCLCYALCLT